jgi:hypothetical protein|tara:strand:- start:84 stop:518 length:435 start_codon:yes stop_codon:yes gene_type:complete
MNNKESEFVPLSEKLSNPLPQRNSIIKGNKIRNIQTKLINISDEKSNTESITDEQSNTESITDEQSDTETITDEQSDTDSDNVHEIGSKIEPILEDNNIVGVTYTCRCGEESEIKFEVASEKTENNLESDDVESNTVEDTIIDE